MNMLIDDVDESKAVGQPVMRAVRISEWLACLELKTCPHCGGTGKCLDDARVGEYLRQIRTARQLSGREIARRMKISAPYLSDMELGRRGWNEQKVTAYLNAVQAG